MKQLDPYTTRFGWRFIRDKYLAIEQRGASCLMFIGNGQYEVIHVAHDWRVGPGS